MFNSSGAHRPQKLSYIVHVHVHNVWNTHFIKRFFLQKSMICKNIFTLLYDCQTLYTVGRKIIKLLFEILFLFSLAILFQYFQE